MFPTLDKHASVSSQPLSSSLFFALLLFCSLSHTHTQENLHTLGQVNAFIFMNRIRSDVTELSSKITEEVSKSVYIPYGVFFKKFLEPSTSATDTDEDRG